MAVIPKDILFDVDNEILIANGDFVVEDSNIMNIQDIITANVGAYKQSPLVGVGINRQQNGSVNKQALKQLIRLQLNADDFRIITLAIDKALQIDVNAIRRK